MSTLNYTIYVSQISNLLQYTSTDTNFTVMLPGMIDFAEQRIYRELDLLATNVTDASAQFTPNQRTFSLPTTQGVFLVVDEINAITPAGTGSSVGTRRRLTPVSTPWLNSVYPSAGSYTGLPENFARQSDTSVILGPSPDAAYYAEVIGTIRPSPLSVTNSSTVLTMYFPDLFITASMVFGTGFQRDFGAQSDNPQMSQSWENQYSILFKSADVEENRKKLQGPGWTSQQPSPIATPPRV